MSVSTDQTPPAHDVDSPVGAIIVAVLLGAGGLVVGFLSGGIVFSIVSSFVALSTDSMAGNLVFTLGTYTALAAVGYVFLLRYELPLSYVRGSIPSLRDLGWTALTIVALLAFSILIVQVIEALGLPFADHSIADSIADDPTIALFFIPVSILLVGPAEEFLYRGVIQTRLRETFSVWPAVLAAAAVFAVVHIIAYLDPANLTATFVTILFVLFPLGALLGGVYEYTENLFVPAVAHGVYNAVVFGFSYAEVVGLF